MLVSPATGDDAAVVELPGVPGLALLQTVDFFTPIVDDPFDFGRIAAANALSDVYAMGGRPLTAMNLVAVPRRIYRRGAGAGARGRRHQCRGGRCGDGRRAHHPGSRAHLRHVGDGSGSIPERIVRNSTMRPGDRLFLTEPLGLGIVSTALKAGRGDRMQVARAVALMTRLKPRRVGGDGGGRCSAPPT